MVNSTEKTQNMSPRLGAQIIYAKMGHLIVIFINDFTVIYVVIINRDRLKTIFFFRS